MTIALRPMPADNLPAWSEAVRRDYDQSRVSAGDSAEVAAEKARLSIASSFPDGLAGPGQLVYDVVATNGDAGNVVVGYLWISRLEDGDAWWVSDIRIQEDHRGAGYGRAAMQLAETAAAEHGAASLGLNVFGYNTAARRLYESLGYETTAVQMRNQWQCKSSIARERARAQPPQHQPSTSFKPDVLHSAEACSEEASLLEC